MVVVVFLLWTFCVCVSEDSILRLPSTMCHCGRSLYNDFSVRLMKMVLFKLSHVQGLSVITQHAILAKDIDVPSQVSHFKMS